MNSPKVLSDRAELRRLDEFSLRLATVAEIQSAFIDDWNRIRNQAPIFASPYFDIEFFSAVAKVRSDVEIAVIFDTKSQTNVIGFLPFQRIAPDVAVPAGGLLNDLHGLMGRSGHQLCLLDLLEKAGLKKYTFHGFACDENDVVDRHEFKRVKGHYIDLTCGWDAYQKWARKNSVAVKRQGQKTRALERKFGPLRFEFDCQDEQVLEKVIKLKREKYQRTKTFDILSVSWASDLLREIRTVRQPGFRGSLSVIWAGDELVSAHFGMMSKSVLHFWFPVFDQKFSKYSPGTQLILDVAKEASSQGITKVDFGFGDDPFKFRFCNASDSLSCGQVRFNRLAFNLAKQKFELRNRLKKMPLKAAAKSLLRSVYPEFGAWNFK